MRNAAKDAREMAVRRQAMLDVGFRLFSERGIDSVSMQEVASACGLGIATLYRYFQSKLSLVIEIGRTQWVAYLEDVERRYLEAEGPAMSGAEEYAFFLDTFLDLYSNHKDLLRFNRSFDTYVQHEGATAEQMAPYRASVDAFADKFHAVLAKGRVDHTLRLDITEKTFFVTSMYTMLAVATKYAEGLVWPTDAPADHTRELTLLRDILYATYAV